MKTATKKAARRKPAARKKSSGRKAVKVSLTGRVSSFFKERNKFWHGQVSRFITSLF